MITAFALFAATLFLAYANGSNDNFKGVATLFGSRTANYRKCLVWATVTTVGGSLFSVVFAQKLVTAFSGKGLVPDALVGSPEFMLAVAIGAGATVLLASVLGFPISTTHSLVGALVGGGMVASAGKVNLAALGSGFFLPLMASPLLALILAGAVYSVFRYFRIRLGVTKEFCICVGETQELVAVGSAAAMTMKASMVKTQISKEEQCIERYQGRFLGVNVQKILDALHFLSAGVVSFARGLNDTPKILALLLVVHAFDIRFGLIAIAMAMATGGWLNARKVANVMSKDITYLNHGQGFTANLITGALVVFASRWGIPVSTTHVSVGSLFGIGVVNKSADFSVVRKIVMSWVLTLPIAGIASAIAYFVIEHLSDSL